MHFRLGIVGIVERRLQMRGTKLRYVIKFVADMNKAVRFYRDVLGLQLKFESPGWSEFVTAKLLSRCTRLPTKIQRGRSNWVSLSPMSRLSTGT